MTQTDNQPGARRRGRPAGRSGSALLDEARAEFLIHGYAGTTMEAVARRAQISKNSLYRQCPSKQDLYAAVVTDWVQRGRDGMRPHLDLLGQAPDIGAGLTRFAGVLQDGVLSPDVTAMRALVAAEAARAPQVAAAYLSGSWEANLQALAQTLATLMERGTIGRGDPRLAADQFTWLVLAAPLNRLTLTGGASSYPDSELRRIASEGVGTFLARFPPPRPADRSL